MARSEEIVFRAGDDHLAGTLLVPDGSERRPWVLLLPSWLARDRDGDWDRAAHPTWFEPAPAGERPTGLLARMATALAEQGVASFRYDKRGCGRSEGSWPASSLFTLIDDARDAIGAMRSLPELDLRRTGIVGHGEGAAVGLSVAIGDPAIGALTLIGAGARSLRDVMRRGAAIRAWTGADRQHPLVAALDRALDELLERAELATMLHRSVTLVHGDADAWAHPDESRLLADVLAAAGNAPRLEIERGAGHDLAELADRRIAAIAVDLAARLQPRDLPPVLLAIEDAGTG